VQNDQDDPYPRIDIPPIDDANMGSLRMLTLLAIVGGILTGILGGGCLLA